MTNDTNYGCGEKQTSSHMFKCILTPSRCKMIDLIELTEITDEMIQIIGYWENEGLESSEKY